MDSSAEGSGNGGSKTAERTVKSMNVYKKDTMKDLVKDNSYVGRGIVIAKQRMAQRRQWLISSWGAAKTAATVSSRRRARML